MAVLPGITDAGDASLCQLHASGALDMEKKGIDGVVHPEQLQITAIEGAVFYLATALIGAERALDHSPGDALAFQVLAKESEVDHHEIRGAPVERDPKLVRLRARSV